MTEEEMYVELLAHKRHTEEIQARRKALTAEADNGDESKTASDSAAFDVGIDALSRGASMEDVIAAAQEAGLRARREHPELIQEPQEDQEEEIDVEALEAQLAAILGTGR